MRAISIILLACSLLACSLVSQRDEPAEVLQDPPPSTSSAQAAIAAPVPYFGEESIEERIAKADTIVKARLNRTTSEVIAAAIEGWSGSYSVAVKFHLTVNEYLKGSGANGITATAVRWNVFNTRIEAEDAIQGIVAKRDATWDDREAIFFLNDSDPGGYFSSVGQVANDHYLAYWTYPDDYYTLRSRYRKVWLPSAETTATGDAQEFLLAVPEPGLVTPTITLGELNSRITSVNAELNGGDGSDEYKECIRLKYTLEREERARMRGTGITAQYGDFEPTWGGTFGSGQPAGLNYTTMITVAL